MKYKCLICSQGSFTKTKLLKHLENEHQVIEGYQDEERTYIPYERHRDRRLDRVASLSRGRVIGQSSLNE